MAKINSPAPSGSAVTPATRLAACSAMRVSKGSLSIQAESRTTYWLAFARAADVKQST